MKKSFKQTVALLLGMIMLIFAMPIVNATNNNVSISVSSTTVNATKDVIFTVVVSGTENARTAAVDVTFGDNFEFVTGQWLKTGSMADYNKTTNKGTFLLGVEAGDLNGELFKLTLKANATIGSGCSRLCG